MQITAKQLAFRDGYLAHGDLERAYRAAGYTGSIKGAYRLLKAPWMDPVASAIARLEKPTPDVVQAATEIAVRPEVKQTVAEVLARPVHPLETRRGRALWLIDVMEGKIQIEREVSYFNQEGERVTDTEAVTPDAKDRLKAAELLQKMSGDHVVRVEADVKAETKSVTAVYVHVDNGRGPLPGPTRPVTGTEAVDACGGCGVVYPRGTAHVCKC